MEEMNKLGHLGVDVGTVLKLIIKEQDIRMSEIRFMMETTAVVGSAMCGDDRMGTRVPQSTANFSRRMNIFASLKNYPLWNYYCFYLYSVLHKCQWKPL